MTQIIGTFKEEIRDDNKIFMVEFFIHAIPAEKRKQTRFFSLAFMDDYLTSFLLVKNEDTNSFKEQSHLKSAVKYIANELLENSIKFNCESGRYPLRFAVYLLETKLIFVSSNYANKKNLESLKEFVSELVDSDIDELYFRHLEKGAEENSTESRLGFLSILYDYSAKMGWKLEPVSQEPEITTVTTMVQLTTH